MKVGSKWFTTGMVLCTILCPVALAPAAERGKMIAVGGNDGMLHKTGAIGPASQSDAPDERQGTQSSTLGATPFAVRTPNTVAGVRGRSLSS
jgi:hypothetical protein